MTSELRRSRRDRAWPGIATPGADAISRRLREGEPFPDGVGRVSSRVIAEPAGQDDAGSPGKHERDLAHRCPPCSSPAKPQCREDGARQMPCSAGIREARNVRDLDVGGHFSGRRAVATSRQLHPGESPWRWHAAPTGYAQVMQDRLRGHRCSGACWTACSPAWAWG